MEEVINIAGKKINFKGGSSTIQLAEELGDYIKNNFKDIELVFEPVCVITPNKAQHNWLKEQLAHQLGFIANLEQHSLNSFFKQLIDKLFPEKGDLPGKGQLVWRLFSALNKEDFKIEFPKIANYCGDDEIKRLALAQKVSGLFVEYEQYQPQLLESWKENKEDNSNEDEAWQASLFRLSGFEKKLISPIELEERILEKPEILKEYREIFLFGDLQFTNMHLQYLQVLQDFSAIKIHIFRSNLRLNRQNPLVQQWGKLAQNTVEDLQKLDLNLNSEITLPSGETDLLKVQNELLKEEVKINLAGDDSLLIYNSFTKLREVEALYNYLVKTVDEANGSLGARDIAVYVPQLDPYIPAIKTVFDTAPYKFPYTLVSKGFSREEGFWSALEQVLNFEKENFTAPAVFNLLESVPIQKSFGFSPELDLLRKAFLSANIRREYKGNPELETNYVSFSYGIERLIYGFCLGDETPVEIEGRKIYPTDIFEGAEAQDLFRLHHLVEKLQELSEEKKKDRSAADWHSLLMKIAEDFLSPKDWQEQRFSSLMQNLISLETSDEKIAFKTFYHRLKDHLQQQDLQQISGSGGIVFSGLYPGQSMPNKIVAFLGLNFKEFPRKSQQLSFDLLTNDDRLGSGDTDRGAFLQAFLNAEEKVLLSYIGQNVKDNSVIPASSIISEIQDYAEKRGGRIKEVKHPLHSFNSAYYDPRNQDLFTYSGSGEVISLKKEKKNKTLPEVVQLYQLEAFLKDPFKYHYNKVLGIYYEDAELLPEWECFELDNLQEWGVKDEIKDEIIKGENLDLEKLRTKLLLESKIPLKNVGRSKLQETEVKVTALLKKVKEACNGGVIDTLEDHLTFNLNGDHKIDFNIKLDVIGEDALFLIVSKKNKLKYELSAYIRALTLKAIGGTGILHYFCLDGDNPHHQEIRLKMSADKAIKRLKELLTLYVTNLERIIPFYPELDLKVDNLKECMDKPEVEKTELIGALVEDRFEAWNSFFPSDYFLREVEQGFFDGAKGEANLLELQKLSLDITEEVNVAFNK